MMLSVTAVDASIPPPDNFQTTPLYHLLKLVLFSPSRSTSQPGAARCEWGRGPWTCFSSTSTVPASTPLTESALTWRRTWCTVSWLTPNHTLSDLTTCFGKAGPDSAANALKQFSSQATPSLCMPRGLTFSACAR